MKIYKAEPVLRREFDSGHLNFLDRLWGKGKHERSAFNERMFQEDFAGIFNYVDRRSGRLFDVTSNDEQLTDRLLSNVRTGYRSHSVDDLLREWTEEIAQSLIWFGVTYYFVDDKSEPGVVNIVAFSSDGVARLFGNLIQWVPKRTKKHWDPDDQELPREIRILDSTKVMRFAMPLTIKRMMLAQRGTLAALDKHQFRVADFHPQPTYENPNPINHFDFRVWRDTQDRALYRSTRETGWTGRKHDSARRSDFFDCHRLIRFRRNQLVLRDDILLQLSAELSRIGRVYNAKFALEISCTDELPSIQHLDKLESRLAQEEAGFTEIIDYCFKC